jgi:hypothetical protein
MCPDIVGQMGRHFPCLQPLFPAETVACGAGDFLPVAMAEAFFSILP